MAASLLVAGPAAAVDLPGWPPPEYNLASTGVRSGDTICHFPEHAGIGTCFKKTGDQLWVRGTPSSGTVELQWQNELYVGGGSWSLYRQGYCASGHGGLWAVCNKDFYENSTEHLYGWSGSRIRWRACTLTTCGEWATWARNDA
ncbi:hypothetical protein [Catellatospora coxensis]|uniref:hypothetical protein n=1 Tax=Catellatospora coxensis TaxID=310354 RepID=UPI001944DA37|nr:hypothetical protein [Catellatospora coxensis]